MNITLSPQLEKFVEDQIKEGRFSSVTEVLEAGLARLMVDPQSDELDAGDWVAIEESERQIARGEDIDWEQAREKCRAPR
jgi:putative addiction module CopG family antidote